MRDGAVESAQPRVVRGVGRPVSVDDVVEPAGRATQVAVELGQPHRGGIGRLVGRATRAVVEHSALLQVTHDRTEPLGDGQGPATLCCGLVGGDPELVGRAAVIPCAQRARGAHPAGAAHRTGRPECAHRDDEQDADHDGRDDQRRSAESRRSVELLLQPVEEPLQQAAAAVVRGIEKLVLEP